MPATFAALGAIFHASPLYVPVSPVSREERCKPCPVALVRTLGCSRPLPLSLLLLASALSGNIIPGFCLFCSSKNGHNIRIRLVTPQKKSKHTGSTMPTDAFAPASTSAARAAGGRKPICPCLHPCPCTHVEIRGQNSPGRHAPKPHNNPIHMCILLLLLLYVAAADVI